jgi:hypothetical protein
VKASTVRGTPVRSISADNGQGFTNSGKPPGYQGVVKGQFAGQSATPGGGTPYNSSSVNDDKEPVRSTGKSGGVVLDPQTGSNMNDPESNGNGVVFDGVTHAAGYRAGSQPPTMDSPVPSGCQKPIQNAPDILTRLRSGEGSYWPASAGPEDNFQTMGGVMSRDMEGSSEPGKS